MKKIKKYWDYYLFIVGELATMILMIVMLELEMFEEPVNAIIIIFVVTIVLAAIRLARCVSESMKKK